MYIHTFFEELVTNGRIFRRVFSKYTHPPSRPNILALQTCACNNSCHVLAHAIAANVVCLPNQMVKWKETRDHAQPHLSVFFQGGQLHGAMVAVGGSYEHWASPVADFDGCLVLHRDLLPFAEGEWKVLSYILSGPSADTCFGTERHACPQPAVFLSQCTCITPSTYVYIHILR